jgi:hypothetical protein
MALFELEAMLKRISKARANKGIWSNHLKECYRYAMPEKQTIDEFSNGTKKRQYIFDDTAVEALDRFAARTQSQVVPAWRTWCKFKAGSEVPPEEVERVEEYLEEATDVLFDHINHSNFNTQIQEAFLDMGISTGCIIVEEGDGINSHLNFRAVTLSEIMPEVTSKGNIGTVWRDVEVAVRDIITIWPRAVLSTSLNEMLRKDPNGLITLVEGVAYDEQTRKYVSMLIYEADKYILFEEELDTSPFIVFRESVIAGETLGRGRIMKKLPAIKTLNKIVEYTLTNAALQTSGLYTATDDGVINPYSVEIYPGAVIPVGSNDSANPTLRPLALSGNPQYGELLIKDLQYGIKNFLLAEPFGQIDETPVRTATEMSIRQGESIEMSAAAFGRVQSELLEPLIRRCVDILTKNGKIAPFKVDGKEVTIKFTSPAAKKQDSVEVQNLIEYAQVMQFLPPDIIQQRIKLEEMPKGVAELMGIPKKYIRSDAEAKQITDQAKKIAQQGQIEGAQSGTQ